MSTRYLTLEQAAAMRGGGVAGLRRWLQRLEAQRPDLRVRRLHGRVHADDLSTALETLSSERERVPRAIEEILHKQ